MQLTTEQIQKAYVSCFDRNADIGGLECWKQQRQNTSKKNFNFAGLAETKKELAAIDKNFDVDNLQNINKELIIIENYT